jgi:MFS family permease
MDDPPGHVAALEVPTDLSWWQRLRHSPFARFSMFFALFQAVVSIASPFFTVYMLRDLHFSYLLFMINTAASVLMQVLTLNAWGRVGDHFGNRKILVICGSLIPVFPMLWTISPNYFYLLCLQAMGGLVWAGFSLSASNFFFDLVPAGKRVTYIAMHNVLASIGIFCGAMLGGYLGSVLPRQFDLFGQHVTWSSALFGVFILSSIGRATVVVLFLPRIQEVRAVKPVSVGGLIFRVARYNALAGLFFDIVGRRRPRPAPDSQ